MRPTLRLVAAFVIGATATGLILFFTNPDDADVSSSPSVGQPAPQSQSAAASSTMSAASTSPSRLETTPGPHRVPAPQPAPVPTPPKTLPPPNEALRDDVPVSSAGPVEVATDDHRHADIAPPDQTVAATVAVAMLTWRFDDDPDRLGRAIAMRCDRLGVALNRTNDERTGSTPGHP